MSALFDKGRTRDLELIEELRKKIDARLRARHTQVDRDLKKFYGDPKHPSNPYNRGHMTGLNEARSYALRLIDDILLNVRR